METTVKATVKTRIFKSPNYIYKVEVTENAEKPLVITREYSRGRGNQWREMSNKECTDAGLIIMNKGGIDALLAGCTEVDDLAAWVEAKNAEIKEAGARNMEAAMKREEERKTRAKAEYERLFRGEVTETNEETVAALLRYLNTQNWGVWRLPKMTIGYSCHQYNCDGKTATTIKIDRPIMVYDEPGTMFEVGAPIGYLTKYRSILE